MNSTDRPRVGIATIVQAGGLILLGKRINSHGDNNWSFPGGHLEHFESFYNCAKRELLEETGLNEGEDVKYISEIPVAITNDFFEKENLHYITLFLKAEQISKKVPKVMEKDKCQQWEYTRWENILKGHYTPLFIPIQNLIKLGYTPYLK